MKELKSIPAAPKAFPLLGNVVQLVRDPQALLASLPPYGDLVQDRVREVTCRDRA